MQDGWNDTPTHNRDYNYQVMVLANRPRDFIGRCFEKGFTRSATGIIELHSGRVYSYNIRWNTLHPRNDECERHEV